MRLYVASSWKNPIYPSAVLELRANGHLVYDFRDANRAFNWSQVDPSWDASDPVLSGADLQRALRSKPAQQAFAHDKGALDWADAGVLVMPCGRSAHLEAGYLIGQGKPVMILLANNERPDLMALLADEQNICRSVGDVLNRLGETSLDAKNSRPTGPAPKVAPVSPVLDLPSPRGSGDVYEDLVGRQTPVPADVEAAPAPSAGLTVIVKALHDLPPFLGADGKTIHLKQGDVASIQRGAADLLIRRSKVILLEVPA